MHYVAKIGLALLGVLVLTGLPACGGIPNLPTVVPPTSPGNFGVTPSVVATERPPVMTATNVALQPTPTFALPSPTSTSSPTTIPSAGPVILEYGPWDHVFSLAWAPEGDLLAAGVGREVYLYNPLDLDHPHILDVGGWVTSFSFSPVLAKSLPAGRLLAMTLRDGSLQIWDTGKGPGVTESRPICKLQVHRKGANSVAFSPDGLTMATTGNDAMVRLWDIGDLLVQGSCKLELKAEMVGGARSVPEIVYHPDGLSLASVDLSVVRIREIATQRLVTTLPAEEMLRSIAFSPNGGLLASAGVGDLVQVWEIDTHELRGSYHLPPSLSPSASAFVWKVAFSSQGNLLAAASNDGRIHFWDIEVGGSVPEGGDSFPSMTLDAHQRAVTCLAFSPDGNTLASGSLDASVRFWQIREILGD
jgi:WD40 repeat protein